MSTEFIELAGKINQQMPYHCVAKAQRALNDRGLPVKGARVAVFGVSYKPGVGDVRESPALKIIALLREPRRGGLLPRPARARAGRAGPASVPLEQALARRRPGADRDRAPRGRPRADRHAARAWWSTCAASRAAPARRERRAPVSAAAGRRRAAGAPLLGEGVELGEDVSFGAYVVVHDGTVIGDGCAIERPRRARQAPAAGRATPPRAARSARSSSAPA